jgi:hypothetical protein
MLEKDYKEIEKELMKLSKKELINALYELQLALLGDWTDDEFIIKVKEYAKTTP